MGPYKHDRMTLRKIELLQMINYIMRPMISLNRDIKGSCIEDIAVLLEILHSCYQRIVFYVEIQFLVEVELVLVHALHPHAL